MRLKLGKAWTKEEDALLGAIPDELLARKYGRTVEAVRARRHLRRIPLPRREWRPEDDKILGTRPDAEIAERLGRVISAITYRRRQLGIISFQKTASSGLAEKLAGMSDQQIARLLRKSHRLPKHVRPARLASAKWSPREDELLGKWPDERLARFLGRTVKAVQIRRRVLRILYGKPSRRWTEEEVRLLDPALAKGPITPWTRRLARQLGRNFDSLCHKRRVVYGAMKESRPWTKRELRLLGTRPDSEVAAMIGRKTVTVQVRRGKLGIQSFRGRNKFRWTPARDRLLGTRPDQELVKILGASHPVIKLRRQELGIPASVRPVGVGRGRAFDRDAV